MYPFARVRYQNIMKKLTHLLSLSLALGLIACGDKTTTKEEDVSLPEPQTASPNTPAPDPVFRVAAPVDQKKAAIQNSFWAVNQHLDLGGSFYLYLSSEQALAKLDEYLDGFSAIADAAGTQLGEMERQQMTMAMDMGRNWLTVQFHPEANANLMVVGWGGVLGDG